MSTGTYNVLKKIGYILRFYRRAKNLSQIEMSEILGISHRNFQRIEAGQVEPRLETLACIAQYLKVPISALIRPTSRENLLIQDVSTRYEQIDFTTLDQISLATNDDLNFVAKMIERDEQILPTKENAFEAEIHGTTMTMSDDLAKLIQAPNSTLDIDQCSVVGNVVERWELLFRLNIKKIVIENIYSMPVGIRIFKSYHHTINPNPDNPWLRFYTRDTTERHRLEKWLKENLKRSLKLFP